ncbi:NAD(P)H-dependent oxidoreductase [soil metagenome]
MSRAKMLKHVVILCHPEADSFNASVAETYCAVVRENGQEAIVRDLYRMDFDPVLKATEQPDSADYKMSNDVAREIELISGAAVIVLVYPIWFGTPPAMLKGYVDRVLGAGATHRAIRNQDCGALLSGVHLRSITSSGNTKIWLDEQGEWQSLVHVFDYYLERAFSMASSEHLHFSAVINGLSERFILQNLQEVKDGARKMCSVLAQERHHQEIAKAIGHEPAAGS